MKFPFWLSGALFACAGHVSAIAGELAPSPLGLPEAAARTLAGHPGLQVYPLRQRAVRARVDAAAMRPAPVLGVELENAFGTGRAQGLDGAEATLALSQVIELGGQRQRRVDAVRAEADGLGIEQAIAKLEVLAELGRRFIHVASDQQQQALTERDIALARRTVEEITRRVERGRSPELELNRARIALSQARIRGEHAEHELLSSRRKLSAMWGDRTADFGPVEADLFDLPPPPNVQALVDRLAASPDFLRFASETRLRDAELRLAEAKAGGELGLRAGLRWLGEGDDAALVAGVTVPLFAARRAAPEIARAAAHRDEIELRARAEQVQAEARVFALVQELRHSRTEARMLRTQVLPQMEAALKATEDGWTRGRYSYLEWSAVRREWLELHRDLIQAAASAHQFQVEIERLTGEAVPSVARLAGAQP